MKVFRFVDLSWLLAIVFVAQFMHSRMFGAQAGRTVAKLQHDAPVRVTDNGTACTLDNGVVTATIDKGTGAMSSLLYHGVDTMGGTGGYWE